jgi:hypothetical protein
MSDASACACIRCGYDLSGQVAAWTDRCPLHGVCPECGLGLRWDEVLVPARVAPGWSIEHSSRPGLAALRGLMRGCTPWRLWGWRSGRLSMGVDLRPARLWGFLACLAAVGWIASGLVNVWMSVVIEAMQPSVRVNVDPISTLLHPERPVTSYGPGLIYYRFAPTLLGLLLLPGAFCLLTQTLARRKLRRAHLVRICAYSLGPVLPMLAFMIVARAFALAGAWGMLGRQPALARISGHLNAWTMYIDDRPYVWAVAFAAWMTAYWAVALRRYLELPRAWLAATLIVIVTSLASVLIVGFWPGSPLFTEMDAFFRGWV